MDIPLVDLSPWRSADPSDRRAVATSLDEAFRSVGFAVLIGHGIDQHAIRALRSVALDFFTLDDAIKQRWRVAQLGDPGWVPVGMEANGYILGEDTPPDLKETFSMWRSMPAHPSGWPALVALGQQHLAATTAVYDTLVDVCALALGLDDPTVLTGPCRNAPNSLSINWYPAIDRVGAPLAGQYRIGPHTDFGTLTLLDREPGLGCLQVQLPDDRWIDAPHVDGALIVNVADLFALWSTGRWRSARHRVLPPDQGARTEQLVSLVSFCEPQADAIIAPLPGSAAELAFEPVVAGEWLAARMAQITVSA